MTRYSFGPDIDLDAEVVLLSDGTRLTEAKADAIATEMRRSRGRPSLSRASGTSPEVKARVPSELKDRLDAEAERRGVTQSALIREALERLLHSAS